MPAFLAENCYFVMAKLQMQILSETSPEKPINAAQVNMLSKLVSTIRRLSDRNSLNETIEACTHLLDYIHDQKPGIAEIIQPYIDGYIKTKVKTASSTLCNLMASHHASKKAQTPSPTPTNGQPLTPREQIDAEEARLDMEDMLYWAQNPPSAEEDNTPQSPEAPAKTSTIKLPVPTTQNSTNPAPTSNQFKTLNRAQRRELERKQKKNTSIAA